MVVPLPERQKAKRGGGCKLRGLGGLRDARKKETGAMLAVLGKVDALK